MMLNVVSSQKARGPLPISVITLRLIAKEPRVRHILSGASEGRARFGKLQRLPNAWRCSRRHQALESRQCREGGTWRYKRDKMRAPAGL